MYGSKRRTEEIRALRKLGGQWLKKQRETVGLSQREFAKEVGLPYYTFMSGTARIPQEHYEIWARALEIPVAGFAREMLKYY
ncbi:MAG TPA: helix-turn-helix transcriptional regulator, partial [Candidatus Acidoferrales bacterium]